MRILVASLVFGLAMTALAALPVRDACMCGGDRGIPLAMLTTRCEVGGVGIVGWAVPLRADPGTNPTSTPMLRVHYAILNWSTWSAVAALALFWRSRQVKSARAGDARQVLVD